MGWFKKLFSNIDQKQANKISVWLLEEDADGQGWITISNQSDSHVYKMIISVVNVQRNASDGRLTPDSLRTYLSVIPPGKSFEKIEIHHGMSFKTGFEIAFEDINKNYWIRTGDGVLKKIDKPPYIYYSLLLPLSWEKPKQTIVKT